MAEHTPTPKLVMGHIEVVAPDGESGIPYDEAVIHLEGDEDSEIEVHCPGALRLAPFIVKAVNAHDTLVKALEVAKGALEAAASIFPDNRGFKRAYEGAREALRAVEGETGNG
jgi:hypothetical protein